MVKKDYAREGETHEMSPSKYDNFYMTIAVILMIFGNGLIEGIFSLFGH